VAIENLDFETKRLTARAGSVNKRYNDMLGSLPSSQFEQMIARACAREHLMLYSVNPLYSSVGGPVDRPSGPARGARPRRAHPSDRQAFHRATRPFAPASHPDAEHDGPGRGSMEGCCLGLGLQPQALGHKAPALG